MSKSEHPDENHGDQRVPQKLPVTDINDRNSIVRYGKVHIARMAARTYGKVRRLRVSRICNQRRKKNDPVKGCILQNAGKTVTPYLFLNSGKCHGNRERCMFLHWYLGRM